MTRLRNGYSERLATAQLTESFTLHYLCRPHDYGTHAFETARITWPDPKCLDVVGTIPLMTESSSPALRVSGSH